MNKNGLDFIIDEERLDLVNRTLCEAFKAGKGIFSNGFKQFLPQWNLPSELEYEPQQTPTSDPLRAALYLWTCAFFERINQSRFIITNAARVWNSKEMRWFFHPELVLQH